MDLIEQTFKCFDIGDTFFINATVNLQKKGILQIAGVACADI